jgi:hypothetical protein
MRSKLKYWLGLVAIADLLSQNAYAAKYDICVNCQNGSYLMGSPTPNPGGSYGSSICASHNAGNLVSITMAQKLGSKVLCIQKAKAIDKLKVEGVRAVDPVLNPSDATTLGVKNNPE